METRANYVVVGLFTVLALLGGFLFVYWQSAAGNQSEMTLLRFRITGSASGLARGSFVMFNGVRVGTVQGVSIDKENPSWAIADAMVDKSTPITRSTQAVVGIAGLTGTANIELSGGNLNEPTVFAEAEANNTTPEIRASASAVANLLQTAQDILTRANNVVSDLERFTGDSRQPLTQTAQNVQKFTDALAKNSDGIDKFLSSASSLSEQLSGLSAKLDGTIKGVEEIVRAVDRDKIAAIVSNAESFSKNANDASKRFDSVVGKVDELLGDENTRGTIAKVGETLESYRKVADTLNTRLGPIADNFDKTLAAYRQVADTVNTRVGPISTNLAETLQSYRQVAQTLSARLAPITDNLERFSGQGLRDAQALINEARRSVTRIEEAVSGLERNPQRIISGGDGEVRRFDGRARR